MRSSNNESKISEAISKLKENDPKFIALDLDLMGELCARHQSSVPAEENLFPDFLEALKKNNTLQNIIIGQINPMSTFRWTLPDMKEIADLLGNHSKLSSVVIKLRHPEIIGFLDCLAKSASIKYLSLLIQYDTVFFGDTNININIRKFLNETGRYLNKTRFLEGVDIRVYKYLTEMEEKIAEIEEDEKTSLNGLAAGLAVQENLKELALIDLPLGNIGIQQISLAGLNAIKILKLPNCQIEEIKHVCYMGQNNPDLQELNLENNLIREKGIKDIANSLSLFKNLKTLNLNGTGLNYSALDFLVNTFLKQNLCVTNLSIRVNLKESITLLPLILKLIGGNSKLKIFKCNNINQSDLPEIINMLKDPVRCKLEKFIFSLCPGQTLSKDNYNRLLTVLRENESIFYLGEIGSSKEEKYEYYTLCDINRRKTYLREWDDFIMATVCAFQEHHSLALVPKGFYFVPSELIFKILLFLEPQTPRKQSNSSTLCMQLINDNLLARRDLLKKKLALHTANSAQTEQKGRPKWWSRSINNRLLFISKNSMRPNLMELKDIASELNQILGYEATIFQGENGELLIFLLNPAPERALYIKSLFARFLAIRYDITDPISFFYDPRNLRNPCLIIKNLLLNQLKEDLFPFLHLSVDKKDVGYSNHGKSR